MSDIKPKLFSTDGHQWGCGINSSLCESTCAFQVALPSINRSTCTVLHGLIFNGLILFSVLVGAQSQQAVGQCVVHSGQFTSASLGHILRPAFMVSGENAKGYELNNVDSVWPVFVCVCVFFFSNQVFRFKWCFSLTSVWKMPIFHLPKSAGSTCTTAWVFSVTV